MAIIGKIREKSTLVLIIIGGAIVAFVLSDLFSSSVGGPQRPINLAEVNNQAINPQEFEARLQKAFDNYEQQAQQELDERTRSTIREQVWTEMISDILLGDEMNELGVKVTSKELFDMVQGNQPHPQIRQAFSDPETGQFNPSSVVNFLQSLESREPEVKQQWIEFERALKRNQHFDKYYALIKKGLYLPAELAKKAEQDNKTTISFQYAFMPYNFIPDSTIEVSASDMKTYYNNNKSDFEQKESIRLSYAFFPVVPSENDMEKAKEWANSIYEKFQNSSNDSLFVNANSDQRFNPVYLTEDRLPTGVDTSILNKEVGFVSQPKLFNNTYYVARLKNKKTAPDSTKAAHILISTQQRPEPEAEALADSLLEVLQGGGDFFELLQAYSDDQATVQDSGIIGWMVEIPGNPFNEACYKAKPGEFTKAKTQFGYHVIQVKEQTPEVEKYQIAVVQREILPSKETFANVFNEANGFSIDANDPESFNALVNEKNIQKRSANLTENQTTIQGLPSSRELVRWARESKENDVSPAYDVDEGFAVVVLESVNKKGIAPLEKVESRVEFLVRQEKKAEQLSEKMRAYKTLGELASGLSITVEKAENVTFASPSIPNLGLEPKVVGKAISLEQGQMSVPIAGASGVYVINITDKQAVQNPNIAQARDVFQNEQSSRIDNGTVYNALKEKADLTDNRTKFY
tara:strand:+ start:10893 stop:12965 length:2073 start_codon:yes stop_codon:yes gene_type:complete